MEEKYFAKLRTEGNDLSSLINNQDLTPDFKKMKKQSWFFFELQRFSQTKLDLTAGTKIGCLSTDGELTAIGAPCGISSHGIEAVQAFWKHSGVLVKCATCGRSLEC